MENSPVPMPAQDVIDREFLEIRAKILELAASLDRIDRGEGSASDRQMELVRKGLNLLLESNQNRAEQVQILFSKEYSENWRDKFGI